MFKFTNKADVANTTCSDCLDRVKCTLRSIYVVSFLGGRYLILNFAWNEDSDRAGGRANACDGVTLP